MSLEQFPVDKEAQRIEKIVDFVKKLDYIHALLEQSKYHLKGGGGGIFDSVKKLIISVSDSMTNRRTAPKTDEDFSRVVQKINAGIKPFLDELEEGGRGGKPYKDQIERWLSTMT